MREELHLAGAELECYAVINSLSLGDNWYMAGVKNLVQLLKKSEPTIISALKNLTDKGLIVKEPVVINNTKRNYYKAKKTFDEKETTLNDLSTPTLNDLSTPTLNDLSPINKVYNKENKKGDNNKLLSPQKSRFKKPTIEEIAAYIEEKKFTFDAERFYDYYESKGWVVGKSPMKDWKAACRTWAAQRKSQIKEEDQEERSGLPAGLTEETWALRQEWMRKFVPRIAERISPEAFLSMQGKSHYNPEIFKDIIIEIDNSDYDGDIAKEFIRLCDTDEYAKRLWSGE
jgi:predicted transcriptional regulator